MTAKVDDKISGYHFTQYLIVYLDKVVEVNVSERENKTGIPARSDDVMALFSSCGVLLHITNDCSVRALLVVACCDSLGVKC